MRPCACGCSCERARRWMQFWPRIKIDGERHGWLLALNTETLAFFHLRLSHFCPLCSPSTSPPPAATGLSPRCRATIIGLSVNTMGRELSLDRLITERILDAHRRGIPSVASYFFFPFRTVQDSRFDWGIRLQRDVEADGQPLALRAAFVTHPRHICLNEYAVSSV